MQYMAPCEEKEFPLCLEMRLSQAACDVIELLKKNCESRYFSYIQKKRNELKP